MWCGRCNDSVEPVGTRVHIQGDEYAYVNVCPICGKRLYDESSLCPLCGESMKRSEPACQSCKGEVMRNVEEALFNVKGLGSYLDALDIVNEMWEVIEDRCRALDEMERLAEARRREETRRMVDGVLRFRKGEV